MLYENQAASSDSVQESCKWTQHEEMETLPVSSCNKTDLMKSLVEEWKFPHRRERLPGKALHMHRKELATRQQRMKGSNGRAAVHTRRSKPPFALACVACSKVLTQKLS